MRINTFIRSARRQLSPPPPPAPAPWSVPFIWLTPIDSFPMLSRFASVKGDPLGRLDPLQAPPCAPSRWSRGDAVFHLCSVDRKSNDGSGVIICRLHHLLRQWCKTKPSRTCEHWAGNRDTTVWPGCWSGRVVFHCVHMEWKWRKEWKDPPRINVPQKQQWLTSHWFAAN